MARRDLSRVLHYFIPEHEQREARAAVRPDAGASAAVDAPAPVTFPALAPDCWAMLVSPSRPLRVALAIDLACVWARRGVAHILAPFDCPPLLPSPPGVVWHRAALSEDALAALARAHERVLVLLAPGSAPEVLERLERGGLRGIVLPVEPVPAGVGRALGTLRRLGPAASRLRVAVLALGPAQHGAARSALRTLESASWRQLGIVLEPLGSVERDREAYRSLLAGVAAPTAQGAGAYGQRLLELGERL